MIVGDYNNGKKTNSLKKKVDIFHSKTTGHINKLNYTKQLISKALSMMKTPYISFSGGKDSTVLLHLLIQQKPDIYVMYLNQGMEYPDTTNFIKKIKEEWKINLVEVMPEIDIWELYNMCAFLKNEPSKVDNPFKFFIDKNFEEPVEKFNKSINADGFFMGLRAEESHDRKMNFVTRGDLYYRANGRLTCCPLSAWKTKDVWAYISSNNLPYNSLYDKNKFQTRDEMRVGAYGLGGINNLTGSFVFLRYYYPYLFNKLAEKNPLIKKYI